METERFVRLRAIYEAKIANGMDTSEFWTIIKKIAKEVPDITLEELRRLELYHYCELYKRLPGVDDFTNLHTMLDNLKDLINDIESIVNLDVSEHWRNERLSDAEVKFGTLLRYLTVAIRDYVGDSFQQGFTEDETLMKHASSYMDAVKKEDIHNLDIHKYYCYYMIPFYKNYHNIALDALNQYNEGLLRQVAEWTFALVLRSVFMIYRLS